jgi:flagellar hook assembly protein FlgD
VFFCRQKWELARYVQYSARRLQGRSIRSEIEKGLQMSTVNSLGPIYTDASVSAKSATDAQELGKTEFLKLLVTQLQNQDPMNPVDNQQFIAQLATFSSLEQLISINDGITKLAGDPTKTESAV